jgi:tRNA 5-methylaminomethyl-2-thiouridine biosynthesis bifunctional protein
VTRERLESPDLLWEDGGPPRSARFGDVYFSREGGLAESRCVFLDGCGLPAAWAGRTTFCVAELGLGVGRNLAALLELWQSTRPPGGRLSIFSVEAYPVRADEAARALAPWPEIGQAARLITDRWPRPARGFHRLDFPQFNARADIALMEAADALAAWSGMADAWFLDGFSPAPNPQMWRPELMALVRAKSAPGARIATYTAAGLVRESLVAQGFAMERAEGFGTKRHRLMGALPGQRREPPRTGRIAIVGAGIAGAALARAFRAQGLEAKVFDRAGSEAPGPPAALAAPRLDAGLGPVASLFAQAARRASDLYATLPEAVISRGAIQLAVGRKDRARFEKIAVSGLFAPGELGLLGSQDVAKRFQSGPGMAGLCIETALVVSPKVIIRSWNDSVWRQTVSRLERKEGSWLLLDATGNLLLEAEVVCLAAGMGTALLAPGLDLLPVRGQATFARGVSWPVATLFGGYVVPTGEGVVFGATHERGDPDTAVRAADDQKNLAAVSAVLPELASRLAQARLTGWAGVRATTSDFLPLAGAAGADAPGLFVLSGLGSRGFCMAPLLAEHVAALALDIPSPLPAAAAELVAPDRFERRARRRGRRAQA